MTVTKTMKLEYWIHATCDNLSLTVNDDVNGAFLKSAVLANFRSTDIRAVICSCDVINTQPVLVLCVAASCHMP